MRRRSEGLFSPVKKKFAAEEEGCTTSGHRPLKERIVQPYEERILELRRFQDGGFPQEWPSEASKA
eukprot:832695-Amphidinium_carterae.1